MQHIFREVKTKIDFTYRTQLNFDAHVHDDIEVVYVCHGGGTACCEGRRYTLTDGSFFLAFPNQIHYYVDFQVGEYIILIIKPSKLLYYNSFFLEGQPESAVYRDDSALAELFRVSLREFQQEGESPIVDGYLTAFFGKLLKHYRIERSPLSRDCTLSILQFCGQNFRDNISIQDISNQLHISRSHVSHIFSRRLRISFCDYMNSLRLNEAVKLLENKAYSIGEVAIRSGYSTIRTFNRAFLKHYGCTPSDYRKALQKVSSDLS